MAIVVSRSSATREAERAAQLALGPRVDAVRDLAAALLRRTDADRAVQIARAQAAELLTAARRNGESTVAAALDGEKAASTDYRAAFDAAVTTGWEVKQLRELGYDRLTPTGRLHRTRQDSDDAPAVAPADA